MIYELHSDKKNGQELKKKKCNVSIHRFFFFLIGCIVPLLENK